MQYRNSSLRVVLTYKVASLLSFNISLEDHIPEEISYCYNFQRKVIFFTIPDIILAHKFPFFSSSSSSMSALSESAVLHATDFADLTDLLDLVEAARLKADFGGWSSPPSSALDLALPVLLPVSLSTSCLDLAVSGLSSDGGLS